MKNKTLTMCSSKKSHYLDLRLLVFFTLLLHADLSLAKSLSIFKVPHSAKPGYAITVLSQNSYITSITTLSSTLPSTLFSVQDQKVLTVSKSISHLNGLKLNVEISSVEGQQNVQLLIHEALQPFIDAPYTGHVSGSEIFGLEIFSNAVTSNHLQKVHILQGSENIFSVEIKEGLSYISFVKSTKIHKKDAYKLLLEASLPHSDAKVYAYVYLNVSNKEHVPTFTQNVYPFVISKNEASLSPIGFIAVDQGDVSAKFSVPENDVLHVNEKSGEVYVKPELLHSTSYEIPVHLKGNSGDHYGSALIQLEVFDPSEEILHMDKHMRKKRAVLSTKTFVIKASQTRDLFTVSENHDERFAFKGDSPASYSVTAVGMVSLKDGSTPENAEFTLTKTVVSDPFASDELPVRIIVVTRDFNSPIFTNLPRPLIAIVQTWMYPGTQVFQFKAIDQETHSAKVEYKIESGANNRFILDPATGILTTTGRLPFNETFSLAVSANIVGAVVSETHTITQELRILSTDRGPQFYEDPMIRNMPESQSPGEYTRVEVKSFFDLKITYTMELQYPDNKKNGFFSINSNTGMVSVVKSVNWESDPRQFRFIVKAKEEYSNFETQVLLIINIEDVNDNTPMFAPEVYTVTDVKENIGIMEKIISIAANDIDSGNNSYVTFSLHGEGSELFSVNNINRDHPGETGLTTADIRVAGTLDYDDLKDHMYVIEVQAADGGSPSRTGTATLKIHMLNVNDNAPEMVPQTQKATVFEEATPNTVVHVVQAFDRDGDSITYQLLDGIGSTYFELNQNTGHIRLKQQLPKGTDQYSLSIKVVDGMDCCGVDSSRSDDGNPTGTVDISVTGVNKPPRFERCQDYKNVTIMEGKPPLTSVENVTATDNDPGDNGVLIYSMVVKHNEKKRFDIRTIGPRGQESGEVYSLEEFDRENPEGITKIGVTVMAQDQGKPQLSALCFFFISIGDINDNDPIFDEAVYRFTIAQSHTKFSNVIEVFAVDDDAGANALVDYTIVSQEQRCTGTSNCFSIPNRRQGWITLTGDIPNNYKGDINLKVNATDNGTPTRRSRQVDVIITVVEDTAVLPPEWQQSDTSFDVDENVNINFIINDVPFKALSRPRGTDVEYSELYIGRTNLENRNEDFRRKVNTTSKTMDVFVNKNLDYEKTHTYALKLRVLPKGGNDRVNFARIHTDLNDKNDNIPRFVGQDINSQYPAAVTEGAPIGTTVVFVSAVDDDGTSPNNLVKYTEADDTENQALFNLDSNTGLITTNYVFTKENISKEFFYRVKAYDGANSDRPNHTPPNTPNSAIATVKVQITGLSIAPPYFTKQSNVVTFIEDQVFNTTVTTVAAHNPAPDLNILQYGIKSGNDDNAFGVDESTGRIFSMGRSIFDKKQNYTLKLRVFDGYIENLTDVKIYLQSRNRMDPRFEKTEYTSVISVTEGTMPTSPRLATVNATDPDNRCSDANMDYYLKGNLVSYRGSQWFSLSNKDVNLAQALNRDYPYGFGTWWLNVEAKDEVGCTATNPLNRDGYTLVKVQPADINDNVPMLDTTKLVGNVDEESNPNAKVLDLVPIDYDAGGNASVTFIDILHLDPIPSNKLFNINSMGSVSTTQRINRLSDGDQFIMNVTFRDNGSPSLEASEVVTINIQDINNHPPQFATTQYSHTIPEEMPTEAYVMDVSARDLDIGENAFRDYSVSGSDKFKMDSIRSTGAGSVKIASRLDYETMTSHVLQFQVIARHPSMSGHTTTATATVTVTDINDHTPVFTQSNQTVAVSEGADLNTLIATVQASDGDGTKPNNEFSYFIDYENTDPEKKFNVSTNGEVRLRNKLDREKNETHMVHVLAIDKGEPPLTGTTTIIVNVLDVNDNAPEFRVEYDFRVGPGTTDNSVVGEFLAKDIDTAENGPPFTFALGCTTSPDCPFTLQFLRDDSGDNAKGVLVASQGDYSRSMTRIFYDIPIIMSDNPRSGEPRMETTRYLRIPIEGTNTQEQQNGNKKVAVYNHNGKLGRVKLGNAYTQDPDNWVPANRKFTQLSGGDNFDVESDGTIYMNEGPPRGELKLTVEAKDPSGSAATAFITVNNEWVPDEAVYSSGSVRLLGPRGFTAESFIEEPWSDNSFQESMYSKFKVQLAGIFDVNAENVTIFTVRNSKDEEDRHPDMIDIIFAAKGSPYKRPAMLNGLVWQHKDTLEQDGLKVVMAPINPCKMKTCWRDGCMNEFIVEDGGWLINSNTSSLVGVNARIEAVCKCASTDYSKPLSCDPNPCMNEGLCSESAYSGFICTCGEGYHGPRCEMTHASFAGDGWGWVEPLDQCYNSRINLEFMTKQPNGLLFHYGPMTEPQENDPIDFLTLQLENGYPVLLVNLGAGRLTLRINGRNDNNEDKLPRLDDGKWHLIDIIKTGMIYRMVVDKCDVSEITENITMSRVDDKACSAEGAAPGDDNLLNVLAPVVQLGGRSSAYYPAGVSATGFNGCFKNLRHNGLLYDLNMTVLQSSNAENQCPREEQVCQGKCAGNSTCIGSLEGSDYYCQCLPGFVGDNCDQEAIDWSFGDKSYIEWKFKDDFKGTISDRKNTISLMYRTRQLVGTLFAVSSTNRMEHIKIEIRNAVLRVRYDLGAGDRIVELSSVNASDGQWHRVTVKREANKVSLSMDSGEGRFYAESPPSDNFREITLGQDLFGGADVSYHKYSRVAELTLDYTDSCMAEVYVNEGLFPWIIQDNTSPAATVTKSENLYEQCLSDACSSVTCQTPTFCKDLWRHAVCSCPANQTSAPEPAVCAAIMDCSIPQCDHGYCVMAGGRFRCHCDSGYGGERCGGVVAPPAIGTQSLHPGGIAGIVLACLLVLLLLILLLVCLLKPKEKEDKYYEPSNDIRDNIVVYDEEGAGEEDYHAYDLTGLRKPVHPDDIDSVSNMRQIPMSKEQMPLGMSAAPMTGGRPPIAPGGKIPPNIGDFIGDRLYDADCDPNAPPYDSIREYDHEGGGSSVGSLSSLATSSSGDLDFDYLNDYGPKFRKLADMYGGGDEEDESNV